MEPFMELVYDRDAIPDIASRWPTAKFEDASDFIHESRCHVTIDDVTPDEFYPWAIANGWSELCLRFQMYLLMREHHGDIRRWIDAAKVLR